MTAAHYLQRMSQFLRLDAFSGHMEVQRFGERQDRANDRPLVLVLQHIRNETAVDLQNVDGQAVQAGKVGIAGAEIVHGDADAQRLDLA